MATGTELLVGAELIQPHPDWCDLEWAVGREIASARLWSTQSPLEIRSTRPGWSDSFQRYGMPFQVKQLGALW
jgi:hypothetical protein